MLLDMLVELILLTLSLFNLVKLANEKTLDHSLGLP